MSAPRRSRAKAVAAGTGKLPAGTTISETGLTLPEKLSYQAWASIGRSIALARRAYTWAIGDWLAYGEDRYGETYTQAIQATGYEEGTLMNLVSVCRRVPPAMRREALSFEHHKIVAYLDTDADRERWLAMAESKGWTRQAMRDAVRAAVGDGGSGTSRRREIGPVTCPKCGAKFSP